MTAVDTALIWLNLAGALLAFVCCIRAARLMRAVWPVLVAAYATLYAAAYVVLLIVPSELATWNNVMYGVSIPKWFVVWALPAWSVSRRKQQLVAILDQRPDQ